MALGRAPERRGGRGRKEEEREKGEMIFFFSFRSSSSSFALFSLSLSLSLFSPQPKKKPIYSPMTSPRPPVLDQGAISAATNTRFICLPLATAGGTEGAGGGEGAAARG